MGKNHKAGQLVTINHELFRICYKEKNSMCGGCEVTKCCLKNATEHNAPCVKLDLSNDYVLKRVRVNGYVYLYL